MWLLLCQLGERRCGPFIGALGRRVLAVCDAAEELFRPVARLVDGDRAVLAERIPRLDLANGRRREGIQETPTPRFYDRGQPVVPFRLGG